MNRVFGLVLLCYVSAIVFFLITSGEANNTHNRFRRYLSFRNISHFFLRVNFKANMVPWNQLFAQAVGFRVNWDEPPDSFHPYHRLYRRDLYRHMETVLDRNGLNGFHCVRRAICEMEMISQPTEIYHRILKMVFRRQSSSTDKWHNKTETECQNSINSCPFSVLEVSQFTDVA
ncbi:uncharacterized protein LOC114241406 [Bombyx mandarina]|uniref:Uncharacterized protein n=2 Tax=Bombyx TaxID=7090 RepID=A0A8R2M4K7_BOMMO|nr:uncharacterized protein LOC105841555 [Bombyx mori]XP_028028038.1 uncharacterized protein LOC114241406 [Bombyx mandarina]XP_037874476.1 uncharacterized protein LOC105841555 [Bombyx mori]